jgi:hypothetical protein
MSEFIREVDEEYRRDQVARFWKRYSGLVIGLAILVVAAVGGWRYWQHAERQKAEAAAIAFDDALRLAREGRAEEAQARLSALAQSASGGPRTLALFAAAGQTGQRDAEAGAKAFDAIAADAAVSPVLQDLARLRAAMLRIDDGDPAAVQASLERLAAPTNPWRHTAREMLGVLGLKRGDFEGAGRWFDQIAADRETPQGLRGRLEVYAALVAAGPVQATQ